MRFRTWPVAALSFLGLLALIVYSLATAYDRATGTSGQLEQLNERNRQAFSELRQVRSDIYLSSIYVRDYLLDNERARDPQYLAELAEFRLSSRAALGRVAKLIALDNDGGDPTAELRTTLDAYWRKFEPLFYWTPAEKIDRSSDFVQQELLPMRLEVLALSREIEALNDASYVAQRQEIIDRRTEYQNGLLALLWQTVVLGLLVAVVAVWRLRELERRTEEQRAFAEEAERRMRTLSQQLVATQEEERRKLSRELHDHVGQLLTGLRMTLGRIERAGSPAVAPTVVDARALVNDLTRLVRDLALGLRPSMLDDLGLQPALEWLGRDMSRRCGLPITVSVDGGLDALPDAHRTCVYRVVQEALTNVVRHARASRADVAVRRGAVALTVTVADDGAGFEIARRSESLGLRGLEERVKELAGSVRVESGPGRGTVVTVYLPVTLADSPPATAEEETRARLAG
jgi:signal transduction histidine kinase